MAIETSASGATTFTGPHIRVYQLVAVKSRIKLEKLFGGPQPTKTTWARHYGLSPRSKPELVISKINDEIDTIMREHPAQEQE